MARAWGVAALTIIGALSVLASSPAAAQLDADQVTDDVGVLATADQARLVEALDRLRDEDGVRLHVLYVETFDGLAPEDWAEEVALDNDLGGDDVLLAVAVGDLQYGYSTGAFVPIDDERMAVLAERALVPTLGAGEWADAAIALAEAYREDIDKGGVSGWLLAAGAAAAAGALGIGAAWYRRSRRRRHWRVDPDAGLDDAALAERAATLLVEADDSVQTCAGRLAVRAGTMPPAREAAVQGEVAAAQATVRSAFATWRAAQHETDPATRRRLLADVVLTARNVGAALDARAGELDWHDLDAAPAALAVAASSIADGMAVDQPALGAGPAAATGALDAARLRLAFASTQAQAVQTALAHGARAVAAPAADAAADALHQAQLLVGAAAAAAAASLEGNGATGLAHAAAHVRLVAAWADAHRGAVGIEARAALAEAQAQLAAGATGEAVRLATEADRLVADDVHRASARDAVPPPGVGAFGEVGPMLVAGVLVEVAERAVPVPAGGLWRRRGEHPL